MNLSGNPRGSQTQVGADGLHASERRILELWDGGKSITEIVEETGYAESTVKVTCHMYAISDREWRSRQLQAKLSSDALIRAIRRTGKCFS
jgi:DNA-binding CsgD family transcriptional regulator